MKSKHISKRLLSMLLALILALGMVPITAMAANATVESTTVNANMILQIFAD